MKNIVTLLIIIPLIFILVLAGQVYYSLYLWQYQGENTNFHIKPGERFASINQRLYEQNLISSRKVFYQYAKFQDFLTKFRSGTYVIKSQSSMKDVFNTLLYGQSLGTIVTIPEGKNIYEIAKIFEASGIASYRQFIYWAKKRSFMNSLDIPADSVEGYLYPETYKFSPNTPAQIVISTMVNEFKTQTENLNFDSSNKLTKHQIITLASIVEKETGAKSERAAIAGIFHNRLKKKMRLQSDPTTIYGIFENFDGNLTKKHLQEKTPYNTYKISGLPQGPIANPGIEAIRATLNPESHDYLYFVSHNDGTHEFTKTYKEHIKAVERYQIDRKNRVGKSWRDLKEN